MNSPSLDRVNEQPPVLLGLSQSELNGAMLIGFVMTPVLLACVFAMIWIWWIGLAIGPLVGLFVIRTIASVFCKYKIGKPENYYPLLVKQRLATLMGIASMQQEGPWAVIRRNRFEGNP